MIEYGVTSARMNGSVTCMGDGPGEGREMAERIAAEKAERRVVKRYVGEWVEVDEEETSIRSPRQVIHEAVRALDAEVGEVAGLDTRKQRLQAFFSVLNALYPKPAKR